MVQHMAVLALTVASASSTSSVSSVARPNVLTVVIDDLGWGDVGYHDDSFHTPTIDDLAMSGVTLSRFYTSPTCTPSRTHFMTGQYNMRIGMQDSVIHATEPRGVPLDTELLSDKMHAEGYVTAAIGKWHLGMVTPEYLPLARGFDQHYGIYTGGGSHTKHISVSQPIYVRGNMDEDIVYSGYNLFEDGTVSSDNYGKTHSTHLYSAKAVDYVNAFDSEKPWFLYLAYQAVHDPMEVGNEDYITGTSCSEISSVGHENSETDYDNRKILCGMMAEVDDGLKSVVLALKSKGVYDNTAIVVFSDNGGVQAHGSVNLPLRGAKADYWEGGVRTPAFLSGGFVQSSLSRNGVKPYSYPHMVHLTDLHESIAGLAGGSAKALAVPSDGNDLWSSFMTGGADVTELRTELLINVNSALFGGSGALLMKIDGSIYKLILSPEPEESGIYNTIRKALATYMDGVTKEDIASIVNSALNKNLGKTRTKQLFDVTKNEGEKEGGTCDDAAACQSLYKNDDYAGILAQMEARWSELASEAAPTTFKFEDDGPLANPGLFNGAWDYWRIEGALSARASYNAVSLDEDGDMAQGFGASSSSSLAAQSAASSLTGSSTTGVGGMASSVAAVSAFLAAFGGVIGLVAFRAGKRAMDYMPI